MFEVLMDRLLLTLILLFFLGQGVSFAGGAAARQQQIDVRPRVNISSPPKPGVWPDMKKEEEIPVQEEEVPPPKPIVKVAYPESKVLVSAETLAMKRTDEGQSGSQIATSMNENWGKIFARFDQSSEMWFELHDVRMRMMVVSRYIDLYGQFGVRINNPPAHYVNLINGMARSNPSALLNPMDQIIRMLAIIEYDYNSGEDKDALARTILTDEKTFRENKTRLGLK